MQPSIRTRSAHAWRSSFTQAGAPQTPKLNWHECSDAAGFECTDARVPRGYATPDGAEFWRGGVTHAGRWCDVFEIRDFKIQRCFIYLDPDYAGADTERYPWLCEGAPAQA